MIVDTSALIAILRDEPEAVACAQAIEAAPNRRMSAANFVEAAIVIDASRDPVASRRLDDLVREAQLVIEAVTEVQARMRSNHSTIFGSVGKPRLMGLRALGDIELRLCHNRVTAAGHRGAPP